MAGDRRICCVWLPRFALAIAARLIPIQNPKSKIQNGMALYRPGTRWQDLLECSPDLEAAGVRPGLPLKEAQARFPGAAYLPCDDATLDAVARAFEAVVEALDAFSPIVEPAPREALGEGRAVAYVDVAGLGPLYGPEPHLAARLTAAASTALVSLLHLSPESALQPAAVAPQSAAAVPQSAAVARGLVPRNGEAPSTHVGLERDAQHSALSTQHSACAGIAATKFTAWVAASLAGRLAASAGEVPAIVVPPGEETTFLAPLPLETLPLPLRDRQVLRRLGVHTLGQFAKLPTNAVQHRYGAAGWRAHQLAQGLDDEPLRPRRLRPAARVEIAFDWEETELDRLTFALKMLTDQLAARLAALEARDGLEAGEQGTEEEDAPQEPWPAEEEAAQAAWPEEEAVPLESLADRPVFGWEADLTPSLFPTREGERWGDTLQDSGAPSFLLPEGKGARGLGPFPHHSPSPPTWRGGQGVRSLDHLATWPLGQSRPIQEMRSAPAHAAEALRVTWRLATGEMREALLRLAEPAASAAAFMEHLRWHAEGLDRFLAAPAALTEDPKLPNELPSPDQPQPEALSTQHSALTYHPLEQRLAVRGIALEAVGIQIPGGTQLKLLAGPLQLGAGAPSRLDPVMRATQARRALAHLQARWSDTPATPSPKSEARGLALSLPKGPQSDTLWVPQGLGLSGAHFNTPPVVWQAVLTTSRLPEHAFQQVAPRIGLQVEETVHVAMEQLPSPSEGEGLGVRGAHSSPLLPHPPFWLVDPPAPALLLPSRRKGGRPILSLNTGLARRYRREVRILRRGGPWKLVDPTCLVAGEPLIRDYYQLETEDGRAYLIFWDRVADTWFLQGIFD